MYCDGELSLPRRHAVTAAEKFVQGMSIDNDIIVANFGGDLFAGWVSEILVNIFPLKFVAFLMAIGMESKLYRISLYVVSLIIEFNTMHPYVSQNREIRPNTVEYV